MGRRHNNKGRSRREGQYAPLSYSMLKHPAWRGLGGNAVKVWLEIRSRYTVRGDDSNNNGELTLSMDEAARLLNIGKSSVSRAFKELQEAGFLVKEKPGHWYGRKATEWRVTDLACKGKLASRDWQKKHCEKTKVGTEAAHIQR